MSRDVFEELTEKCPGWESGLLLLYGADGRFVGDAELRNDRTLTVSPSPAASSLPAPSSCSGTSGNLAL